MQSQNPCQSSTLKIFQILNVLKQRESIYKRKQTYYNQFLVQSQKKLAQIRQSEYQERIKNCGVITEKMMVLKKYINQLSELVQEVWKELESVKEDLLDCQYRIKQALRELSGCYVVHVIRA